MRAPSGLSGVRGSAQSIFTPWEKSCAACESLHVGKQPYACINLDTSSLLRDGGWASIFIGVSLLFHFDLFVLFRFDLFVVFVYGIN